MEPPETSRLTLLKEYLGNDPIQVKEMVDLFIQTFPGDMHDLELSCIQNNHIDVQKTAHRLKSAVRLFNVGKSVDIILEIETMAKNRNHCSQILTLIQQFKSSMEAEVEIIKKEAQQLS